MLNPGQPQVNENDGDNGTLYAIQRCPNGAGGPRNTDTYTVTASNITTGTIITNTLAARTSTTDDDPTNNVAKWPATLYKIVPMVTARTGYDGDLFAVERQVIYVPGTYNGNGWGLQDAGGGIAVFYNPPPTVNLGDMVRFAATRDAIKNEEQLADPVAFFQNFANGPELPPTPPLAVIMVLPVMGVWLRPWRRRL